MFRTGLELTSTTNPAMIHLHSAWQTPLDPRCKSKAGFSIIELIAVLGVIILLAGLSCPLTTAVRTRAQRVSCLNNLRQWGLALNLYLDENRGLYPTWEKGKAKAWFNVLPPYLDQPTMAETAGSKDGVVMPDSGRKSLFLCPADHGDGSEDTTYYSSYTFNTFIAKSKKAARQHQIKNPDRFVVFAETPSGSTAGVDLSSLGDVKNGSTAFRHAGSACFGFADGHAASFPRDVVWRSGLGKADNFGPLQWNPQTEDAEE
jgi:prepilin-type processing-associated H-X9-DG protein